MTLMPGVAGKVGEVGCFCPPCQCVQVSFQCTSRKVFPVLCHSRPSLLSVWTQRAGIQGEISFLIRSFWGVCESKVPDCSCFLWSCVELGWAGLGLRAGGGLRRQSPCLSNPSLLCEGFGLSVLDGSTHVLLNVCLHV